MAKKEWKAKGRRQREIADSAALENIAIVSKLRTSITAEMPNLGRLADAPLSHCMGRRLYKRNTQKRATMTTTQPGDRPNQSIEMESESRSESVRAWRFWLPLALQTALVLAIPAQNAYTTFTGRTVILQTAPVDPYDLLRGYSQTLGYDISTRDNLEKLPGGNLFKSGKGGTVYVVLEAPKATATKPPKPWKPVRVSGDRPTNLPSNQIAIQGLYDYAHWRINYGLETYYMPEDQREQVNTAINKEQQGQRRFVVETKVDSNGKAVPISLWVRDRNYRF
jgi:uncharacterized membrane-anchored protein